MAVVTVTFYTVQTNSVWTVTQFNFNTEVDLLR